MTPKSTKIIKNRTPKIGHHLGDVFSLIFLFFWTLQTSKNTHFPKAKTRCFKDRPFSYRSYVSSKTTPQIRSNIDQTSIKNWIKKRSNNILIYYPKMSRKWIPNSSPNRPKKDPGTTSGSEMCQRWSKRAPNHQFRLFLAYFGSIFVRFRHHV